MSFTSIHVQNLACKSYFWGFFRSKVVGVEISKTVLRILYILSLKHFGIEEETGTIEVEKLGKIEEFRKMRVSIAKTSFLRLTDRVDWLFNSSKILGSL